MKFDSEKDLAEYVNSAGGVLYRVGGAVRDEIMGIDSKDIDYVITGITSVELKMDKIVGQDFPVFLADIAGKTCEVALARKERKSGKGYHGFEWECSKSITIEEDLYRRDLTINAMAKEVLSSKIIDPYNGKIDITNNILRHVSEHFKEDPLRVYRVARFACTFPKFIIDKSTEKLMSSMKKDLLDLTPERVYKELEKVLNSTVSHRFFEILNDLNLLDIHFKEIYDLNVPDMHDGTTFKHTMKALLYCGSGVELKFGILCHDLGKGLTDKAKHPHHFGHEELGELPVNNLCDRLKIPNKLRKIGIFCATNHMRIKKFEEMRKGKVLNFILKNKDIINILSVVSFADSFSRDAGVDREREVISEYRYARELVRVALEVEKEVTGDTLISEGYKPCKTFGETLLNRRTHLFIKKIKELKV